jgi:hypothetical protein
MEPEPVQSDQGEASRPRPMGMTREQRTGPPQSGRWWGLFSFVDTHRITSSIGAFRIQLEDRIAQCRARGEGDPSWAVHARQLLQRSEETRDQKDVDGASRYLRAAQRMELYGLTPEELRVRAAVLAIEVKKKEELSDWRRESVLMIVSQVSPAAGTLAEGTTAHPNSPPQGAGGLDSTAGATKLAADHIAYAFQLKDEYHDNQDYRLTMLREKLTVLLIALLLAVLAVLVLTPPTLSEDQRVERASDLAAVALFGCLGASLSAITSITQLSIGHIPHPRFLSSVTMMRPVVGAAAALGLYVFLASGLLNLGGRLTVGPVLAASFAAGFSERLIIRTVESVAGRVYARRKP